MNTSLVDCLVDGFFLRTISGEVYQFPDNVIVSVSVRETMIGEALVVKSLNEISKKVVTIFPIANIAVIGLIDENQMIE